MIPKLKKSLSISFLVLKLAERKWNKNTLEELSRAYYIPRGYLEYEKAVCPDCIAAAESMKPSAAGGNFMQCACGKEIAPEQLLTFQAFRQS